MAVDVTMRSVLTAGGQPHPRAASEDAAIANAARADKEAKYPELLAQGRCVLVVLALETGGRFSKETFDFLEELAFAKASEAPPAMRKSAKFAWHKRWVRMLACTAACAWCHAATAPVAAMALAAEAGAVPDWHDSCCF